MTKLETAQIKLLEAQTRQIEAAIEKDKKMSEWYDAQIAAIWVRTDKTIKEIQEKYGR